MMRVADGGGGGGGCRMQMRRLSINMEALCI